MTRVSTTDAGTAHLTFTRSGSNTVLTRAYAASPAKVIATRSRAAACAVYSATFGGGIVGGDDIRLTADVAAGARAVLTTQASTKVYRSLRPSSQTVSARVGAGGVLAVVPDPIVCFAGADFTQTQRYELHPDANLVAVDWLTSGRRAAGERWAFSRYESRLDVRRGSRGVLADAIALERDAGSIAARMGRFEVIVTAIVTGPLVADAAADLLARTSRAPIAPHPSCLVSAARLRDGGTLLRMAGVDVEETGDALRREIAFVSALVGDDIWSRKW